MWCDPSSLNSLNDLKPCKDAQVPVITAAGADGVYVRSRHDRRAIHLASHNAYGVTNDIDRDLKAKVTHPADHQVTAVTVLVGKCQPSTPLGSCNLADRGKICQSGLQAVNVYPKIRTHVPIIQNSPCCVGLPPMSGADVAPICLSRASQNSQVGPVQTQQVGHHQTKMDANYESDSHMRTVG